MRKLNPEQRFGVAVIGSILVGSLMWCALIWGSMAAYDALQQELADVKAEHACVAKLVSQGVERKHIRTFKGKCEAVVYTVKWEE